MFKVVKVMLHDVTEIPGMHRSKKINADPDANERTVLNECNHLFASLESRSTIQISIVFQNCDKLDVNFGQLAKRCYRYFAQIKY